jgi:hypothetical protein
MTQSHDQFLWRQAAELLENQRLLAGMRSHGSLRGKCVAQKYAPSRRHLIHVTPAVPPQSTPIDYRRLNYILSLAAYGNHASFVVDFRGKQAPGRLRANRPPHRASVMSRLRIPKEGRKSVASRITAAREQRLVSDNFTLETKPRPRAFGKRYSRCKAPLTRPTSLRCNQHSDVHRNYYLAVTGNELREVAA